MLVTGHTRQPSPEGGAMAGAAGEKGLIGSETSARRRNAMKKSVKEAELQILSLFSVTRDSIPETTTEKCETFILSGFSFFAIHPIDFPLRFSFILLVRPLSLSRRSPRTHKQHGTPHDCFFFLLRRFTIE